MGADPAMGEYLPTVGQDVGKLPGVGGVFNPLNLSVYHYGGNSPLMYLDPGGDIIVPVVARYNMSSYYQDDRNLGRSSTIKFAMEGCYVTTFANVLYTAEYLGFIDRLERGQTPISSPNFTTPDTINSDEGLFAAGSAGLPRESSMDALFGSFDLGNWDYWTREVQGTEGLLQLLQQYSESEEEFMIIGIFDLSDASPNVNNHMVTINGLPGNDGVFAPEDIGLTSQGDRTRLGDPSMRQAYSIDNVKELRVVPQR